MEALGENTLRIDCDVIQADAGTRTAAISGSWVALHRACERLVQQGILTTNPVQAQVAAVSVGVIQNRPLLDLDYSEDSHADVDLNVVMNGEGQLLELQGTAEGAPFSRHQLNDLLDLAEPGLKKIMDDQQAALSAG
jgi:ribonuclease PH